MLPPREAIASASVSHSGASSVNDARPLSIVGNSRAGRTAVVCAVRAFSWRRIFVRAVNNFFGGGGVGRGEAPSQDALFRSPHNK